MINSDYKIVYSHVSGLLVENVEGGSSGERLLFQLPLFCFQISNRIMPKRIWKKRLRLFEGTIMYCCIIGCCSILVLIFKHLKNCTYNLVENVQLQITLFTLFVCLTYYTLDTHQHPPHLHHQLGDVFSLTAVGCEFISGQTVQQVSRLMLEVAGLLMMMMHLLFTQHKLKIQLYIVLCSFM